jgi:hypothetical protein
MPRPGLSNPGRGPKKSLEKLENSLPTKQELIRALKRPTILAKRDAKLWDIGDLVQTYCELRKSVAEIPAPKPNGSVDKELDALHQKLDLLGEAIAQVLKAIEGEENSGGAQQ